MTLKSTLLKITHLKLAFLNPDPEDINIGATDICPIVALARNNHPNIKIFISIAGGKVTDEMPQAYCNFLTLQTRPQFVQGQVAISAGLPMDFQSAEIAALQKGIYGESLLTDLVDGPFGILD